VSTNVPTPTFGPTGFIAPAESAILAGVVADINAAFGGGLNPALSTPQGQLASSQAACVGNCNDAFIFLSNQFDPAYASGRYQDALARIYFLNRNPAQSTVVQALCTGLANVPIPVGAQAVAEDGNLYTCTQGGTIPVGGSITLAFACNVTGSVSCPAGTLNQIYQAIPGWDTVTNLSAGTPGNDVESTYQFEQRRQATVAGNSVNTVASVLGAVLQVPGVLQAYVTENATAAPLTVGGVTLVQNSLYVSVVGGAASAVAAAIWSKKPPGCNYNGNTSFVVSDTSTGYSPPYPSYTVTWNTPASLPIIFNVNLVSTAQVPANAASLVQAAIISAFAGGDGGPVASIGSLILASRFYEPVGNLGSWAQIRTLTIGSPNVGSASVLGAISGNTLTVRSVQSGSIAVGETVTGTGVPDGTTVTSFIGGAGGTGTYGVSIMQSIGASFTAQGTGAVMTVSAVTGTIGSGYYLLNGTGVPSNTTFISQLSGGTVGGSGTYQMSNAVHLPSGVACTSNLLLTLVNPTLNSVQVNINQVPEVSAANIAVTVT
jgi:Baseplate J-like protein